MTRVDVHQHLWTEGVLTALERRSAAPCATWSQGRWTVTLEREPAFAIDPADHDVERRAQAVRAAGVDRALVALSSPVGVEALPVAEAEVVLDAYHADALALPDAFGTWATLPLLDPDPARVDALLDAGAIGLCVPAGALAGPEGFGRLGRALERLQDRLAPLFVHPGPAPWGAARDAVPVAWWASCTSYVAEMHAAWHAFAAWGRPAFERLHVVFALLSGLAPLHAERTCARGGPAPGEPDPLIFYDTSSYGPRGLRAMAASVGVGQLVHGTDAPVQAPPTAEPLGAAAHEAMRSDAAARLLGTAWVAA